MLVGRGVLAARAADVGKGVLVGIAAGWVGSAVAVGLAVAVAGGGVRVGVGCRVAVAVGAGGATVAVAVADGVSVGTSVAAGTGVGSGPVQAAAPEMIINTAAVNRTVKSFRVFIRIPPIAYCWAGHEASALLLPTGRARA